MRRRFIALTLMLAGSILGQSVTPNMADDLQFYTATYQETLSGAGTAFTLQAPVKSNKRIYAQMVILECSVNCTVLQDRNGTAATTTEVTAVALNTEASPAARFYRSSNAGTGSGLLPLQVKAGIQTPLDMSYTVFGRGFSLAQNHNWRVQAMTGTVRATVIWAEK